MHHRLVLGAVLLLSACAQRYAAPASTRTVAAPDETFDCVKRQLSAMGYKQTSIDTDEHRISGSKIDDKSRRADTQFRRILDKLEVEVSPEADGQTSIAVQGRTFAEYTTQRGPTEVEEKPSSEVTTSAQQLLERCRG
ncbi:MAG TPA: hypothetical protein VD930_11165 [Gemmatimonadales bacterium]|nr:hypothetical protein [Gemmatimonadales bacterium]